MITVLPLVEGEGDVEAVPQLLRRIRDSHQRFDVEICRPHRRGDFYRVRRRFDDYLRAGLNEANRLLWVLDCDDGCPVELARELEALYARNPPSQNCKIKYAFIVKEYETLFLAEERAARARLSISKVFHRIQS